MDILITCGGCDWTYDSYGGEDDKQIFVNVDTSMCPMCGYNNSGTFLVDDHCLN